MRFLIDYPRADELYLRFLDWRAGLDSLDSLSVVELAAREQVSFATWLRDRNEPYYVH